MVMENKERQIKDLEKKIELAESAVKIHFEQIGELAIAADDEKKDASLTVDLLREIEKVDSEINHERERINDILSSVERADDIEALRKSLTDKIKSIEKDNISNYETIGRASYEAYKEGELPSERYAGIFAEIIRVMVKIDDSESERERITSGREEYGFFKRLKSGARGLYLKNAVTSSYNQLQRQYKKAGEQICHSELIMNLEAESVENAVKPFRENMEGIEKLEQEDQKLTSENEELRGNLEGLGVQTNAVKTVSEIENHINDLYFERKAKQNETGEMISLNRMDSLAKLVKVKEILKDINKEKASVTGWQEEIKACEAEIEIERQNNEIKALNKKINGFEEKITNYSEEAEQLKAQINLAEENIKKLEDASNSGDNENG